MNRRHFTAALCLGLLTAGMAQAVSFEDAVVAQLRAQGYRTIEVERTLLGRVKISASQTSGRREIILNPRTGEVLRDLWIAAGGSGSMPAIISGASGSGTSGDDHEDEDDPAEDGDHSGGDHSGSGQGDGGDEDED